MKFQGNIHTNSSELLKYAILNRFKEEASLLLLDGNKPNSDSFEWMIAVGAQDSIYSGEENAFEKLQAFYEKHQDWIFGSLAYDLKNGLEKLDSANLDGVQAADLHFFLPKYLFVNKNGEVKVYHHSSLPEVELGELDQSSLNVEADFDGEIKARVDKADYIDSVVKIKNHIQRGDIYEMNYCQEFYAEHTALNPIGAFQRLNTISKAPFSCFYKQDDKYLLSASPERFIKKEASRILSQPIKGTRKRGINAVEDERLKRELFNDQKERSENVMIVDLVRNDLSKIAKKSSVQVDELFGIYTFDQVHQMISTISCEVDKQTSICEILKATFPMGSMTGAPKIRAMELIEAYEQTKRGLYSGAVGYMSPTGDFDFNVVIRSILYNATNKYLSFMVGGAITIGSQPELEYQECLVKAKAIFEVLEEKHAESV